MIQLTETTVRTGAHASTKQDAIRQVGDVLVAAGHIQPGYIESMFRREQQANTYLGNGIAIPHGQPHDRDMINQTSIAVLQVPDGVEWNEGERAYLIIGIAARSDEHLGILANLTDVLGDTATVERLAHTTHVHDIIESLSGSRVGESTSANEASDGAWDNTPAVDVTIASAYGLHARPATMFVDIAGEYAADVRVEYNGNVANGKAMASLLRLGVEGSQSIRIRARGVDAEAALDALREAVEAGLGDEEAHDTTETPALVWTPQHVVKTITGVAAAPGLAIAPIYQFKQSHIVVDDQAKDAATEKQHLRESLATAHAQLGDIYESVKARAGRNEATIFRAHQAFLDDADLIHEVEALIDQGHSAVWSWQQVIATRIAAMQQVQSTRLAERAADFSDVGQRVLRVLAAVDERETALPNEPFILVADDLLPSDTARLDPQRILGICTAASGPTSHTAIIARSLDIPAVVSAGAAVLEQPEGTRCILDGGAGMLYVNPCEGDVESARQFQVELQQQRNREYLDRYQPALLTDGSRVEVVANIGKAVEAQQAVDAGAEGVGLMRTEFLFFDRTVPPSEEEQVEAYTTMIRALNGLPLIIRTLDIGGDKALPYLSLPAENNPFLGVRGIRLCLRKPDLFRAQLRAIYRASMQGPVKIMFPMIAMVEELREAKALAEEVRLELGVEPVEIGIMVEVPSTVMLIKEFADEVDFFSIGTNDLTQYTLAIDRMHPVLAKHADALHPAVLRLIEQTAQAANAAGKWVGACGGIAGDPQGAVILAGLGVTELSMSIPSIAAVKAKMRQVSLEQCRTVARKALACTTAEQVRQLSV